MADISQILLPGAETPQNIKALKIPYGTCGTAAGTAAKTVTIKTDNGSSGNNAPFVLEVGTVIAVKFTVTNTAASPTLNVNSTGAKAIYYRGANIAKAALTADRTYQFVYNGTQWEFIGDIDTDTKVTTTAVNPRSTTDYYPTFCSGANTGGLNYNNYLVAHIKKGTTSIIGFSGFLLGNNIASGTANNAYGYTRFYSQSTGYATIMATTTATTETVHYLPTTGGTILNTGTTSFTQTLTSGTKIGSIKIDGTSTDIYCQTNTDIKVRQALVSEDTNRPLLMAHTDNTTTTTNIDNTAYRNNSIYANPSTGAVTAKSFVVEHGELYSYGTDKMSLQASGTSAANLDLGGGEALLSAQNLTEITSGAGVTIETGTGGLTISGDEGVSMTLGKDINFGDANNKGYISTDATSKNIKLGYDYQSASSAPQQGSAISCGSTNIGMTAYGNVSITATNGSMTIKGGTWPTGTGTNVVINGGQLVKYSSSLRYKNNIDYDIDKEDFHNQLMSFKPCTYEYNELPYEQNLGLIAEDVYEVNPQLVNYDDDFEIESFRDRDILTMLIVEAQEKDKKINQLEQRIAQLEALILNN